MPALDPIEYRKSRIEAVAGVTVTLCRDDEGDGWSAWANADSEFHAGSRTVGTAFGSGPHETLDCLVNDLRRECRIRIDQAATLLGDDEPISNAVLGEVA